MSHVPPGPLNPSPCPVRLSHMLPIPVARTTHTGTRCIILLLLYFPLWVVKFMNMIKHKTLQRPSIPWAGEGLRWFTTTMQFFVLELRGDTSPGARKKSAREQFCFTVADERWRWKVRFVTRSEFCHPVVFPSVYFERFCRAKGANAETEHSPGTTKLESNYTS